MQSPEKEKKCYNTQKSRLKVQGVEPLVGAGMPEIAVPAVPVPKKTPVPEG